MALGLIDCNEPLFHDSEFKAMTIFIKAVGRLFPDSSGNDV